MNNWHRYALSLNKVKKGSTEVSFEKTACTKCTKNTMGHKIRVVIKYKVYLFITNILEVSIYEAHNNY
jgi:hypothetical protein